MPGVQSTDAENSRASLKAKNAGDALTQVSSKSSQAIALDRENQATVGGSGGDAVTGALKKAS